MLAQFRASARRVAQGSPQLQSAWKIIDSQLLPAAAWPCLEQAAWLVVAGDSGGSGSNKRLVARRDKDTTPRPSGQKLSGNSQPNNPAWLAGRFKSRARANDAAGAEYYYRSYIQAGGQPRKWMLPMLLGTYGRLRQADKAWAVYERLLDLRRQRQPHGHTGGLATLLQQQEEPQEEQEEQQRQRQQEEQLGQQQEQQWEQQQREQGEGAGWEQRAAQRRRRLNKEAAWLVSDLRLDALPLEQYAYSALITSLSRAGHPPYDLAPEYAEKAATVFAEMRCAGIEPNVVLWHNLLDCQAKAGLADAAFETYHAMRAAGARSTSWTFSMLVSACSRAGQPERAAEVVERLMPQAGVLAELPVWNALLGAYGRAGSVDAAYSVWMKMLESDVVPDECTERVLALAFGSHPSLAADVVTEARQVQERRHTATAAAAAVAQPLAGREQQRQEQSEQEGESMAAEEAVGAGNGGEGHQRSPYRLHQHRQSRLEVDDTASRRPASRMPPGLLMMKREGGGGSATAAAAEAEGVADGDERQPATAGGQDLGEAYLRGLLLLDLHGSSQAAARMILLRRLETLVLQAPEVMAQVDRLRKRWRQRLEWQRQRQQLQKQQRQVAGELLGAFEAGASAEGSSTEQQPISGTRAEVWPVLGLQWTAPPEASDALSDANKADGEAEAAGQRGAPPEQPPCHLAVPSQQRFQPPALVVITGMGRHSKGQRGGVLKAAVWELLEQQGLPVREDPGNEGVVLVPWRPLKAYLQRQRQTMHTDHFLNATRIRYLYILSGVAGVMAAAHILPRLGPWMV